MSYTSVYAIRLGQSAEVIDELRNAWGSAPVIWDAMCKRWLDRESWLGDDQALWGLALDKRVPECERAVLALTYDRAFVKAEDMGKAIGHIEEFLERNPVDDTRVNHWPQIVTIMKDLMIRGEGVAFHMTSVSSDDYWQGDWNDEKEEYDGPVWDKVLDVYQYIA